MTGVDPEGGQTITGGGSLKLGAQPPEVLFLKHQNHG